MDILLTVFLSVAATVIAGVILLTIQHRTNWFSKGHSTNVANRPDSFHVVSRFGPIGAFVDDMIRQRADLQVAPGDIDRVREVLVRELENDINAKLVNLLSDRDQILLDRLLDTNPSDEQLGRFFQEHIPDVEGEISRVLLDFRRAYLYPATHGRSTSK